MHLRLQVIPPLDGLSFWNWLITSGEDTIAQGFGKDQEEAARDCGDAFKRYGELLDLHNAPPKDLRIELNFFPPGPKTPPEYNYRKREPMIHSLPKD